MSSQCLGKTVFKSKEIAEQVAKTLTEKSHAKGPNNRLNGRSYGKGLSYRVYKCNICPHWHHSTQPLRKGKK